MKAASSNVVRDDGLACLPEPSLVGKAKVGGIDFHKQRLRRVAKALALCWRPEDSQLRNWRIQWPGPTAGLQAVTARAPPPAIASSLAERTGGAER